MDKVIDQANNMKIQKVIGLLFCLVIIIFFFLWIYNKLNLDNNNCKNMNSIYTTFPNISNINPSNSNYQYNLRDYYIKTSYNCCSAGQFKNDFVNVCALKNVIKQGARCLDFQIYSFNDKPVIATSSVDNYTVKEVYNSVDFSKAMDIISKYAYSGSNCPNPNDPLLLHFRIMSNNLEIYDKMANIIEEKFSDKILGPDYSYENQGKNIGSNKLANFINKIIIMIDKSNNLFTQTKLNEYVNIASNSVFLRLLRYNKDLINNPNIDELIQYNKRNMSIVLPDNSSSYTNPDSSVGFKCGCQFIGMCFQNFDTKMEYYSLYFDNKGKAFVLKSEALRFTPNTVNVPPPPDPDLSFQPRSHSTDLYDLLI